MAFPVSPVSFSVTGDLARLTPNNLQAPLAAIPVRAGTCVMPVTYRELGPFSDAWWRFYVNDGDGMIVHCGKNRVRIPAWTLTILPAWLTWQITMTKSTNHSYVEVDCPSLSGRQITDRCQSALVIPLAHSGVYVAVARTLLQGNVPKGASNALLSGIHQVMAHLVDDLDLTERHPSNLAAVLTSITDHLGDDLRVPALATRHHVSPKTLTTLFQRHLGVTPATFVRERRLAQACRLLRETDFSIDDIATRIGFTNRAYLSRLMAKMIGLPPATYRRGPTHE